MVDSSEAGDVIKLGRGFPKWEPTELLGVRRASEPGGHKIGG